jgi:hypothetical protein
MIADTNKFGGIFSEPRLLLPALSRGFLVWSASDSIYKEIYSNGIRSTASSATKDATTKKGMGSVGALKAHGPALFHLTEKLVPSLDRLDGKALMEPLLDTIVIC